ncbi:MAG: response regulator, partial [Clostridia bacterium]|nr:response regulator [Clostridia bacterium]
MRILVAEDERALNRILVKQFAKLGYSVDSCFDGESVFDFLAGAEYDAVVMDVMMPKADGFAVLKKMREQKNQTPVIFLTARTE